jgi:hypothetical protein
MGCVIFSITLWYNYSQKNKYVKFDFTILDAVPSTVGALHRLTRTQFPATVVTLGSANWKTGVAAIVNCPCRKDDLFRLSV